MMRGLYLAAILVASSGLSASGASAQSNAEMQRALGELSEEMQICNVYFFTISVCIAPQRPDLGQNYQQLGERIDALANETARAAGIPDQTFAAQQKLYAEAMMKAMSMDCRNIAVLLQKYMNFCKALSENADPRLKEWIACVHARSASCGGPGLP